VGFRGVLGLLHFHMEFSHDFADGFQIMNHIPSQRERRARSPRGGVAGRSTERSASII